MLLEVNGGEVMLNEIQYLILQKIVQDVDNNCNVSEASLTSHFANLLGMDSKILGIFLDQLLGKCKTNQSIRPMFKTDFDGRINGVADSSQRKQFADYFISGFTDYVLSFYHQSSLATKKEKMLSETAIDSIIIRHIKKLRSVLISSLTELVPDQKTVVQSIERLKDKGLLEIKGNYAFYS